MAVDRLSVLGAMIDQGVIPVFYHPDLEVCSRVIQACADGGAKCVEFTNRGDFAAHVFLDLARHFAKADPSVIMGVGSIVDAPTAGLYIANGARFVVGPMLNAEVARLCNRRMIAYSPGCGSADLMDRVLNADVAQPTYPPYNIEKTAEDAYRISVAVAGFAPEELAVDVKDGALLVTARKADADARTYLHRGIATRAFERRFALADHVRVTGAAHENGMLHIDLVREMPEALKPRRIEISTVPGLTQLAA